MKLNINITEFEPLVTPVVRPDQIIAYVVWIFHTSAGDIKITGCTLRRKTFEESKTTVISFEPPAIRGKLKFFKTLYIGNPDLYKQLCQYTKKKYCELTGEPDEDYEESISPEDIPL
ncbi:MAG: hypothetical protein ACD_57C00220G0002 [uncultured bacterium]|nr:MAG: hypothetical protein ACD_57C00220G0002 [uncultured bacterium]